MTKTDRHVHTYTHREIKKTDGNSLTLTDNHNVKGPWSPKLTYTFYPFS